MSDHQLEIKRQFIHALGIFIALLMSEAYKVSGGGNTPAFILSTAIIIGYGISYLYKKGINLPVLTKMIKESERERYKKQPIKGTLTFLIGSLLTLLIFRNNPDIVVAGIIVLSLGDSLSTIAGVMFGKHKMFYNKSKSVEGFVGGFVASFLGLMVLTEFSLLVITFASLVGLIVESLPLGLDDNITIPIITALSIWILTSVVII